MAAFLLPDSTPADDDVAGLHLVMVLLIGESNEKAKNAEVNFPPSSKVREGDWMNLKGAG